METYVQGCEAKLKSGSVAFPVFPKKSVRFGRFEKKNSKKKTKPEPNISRPISPQRQPNGQYFEGFGVYVLAQCVMMFVWCQVAFPQHLRLLRHTVQADIYAKLVPVRQTYMYFLQQTKTTVTAVATIKHVRSRIVRGFLAGL